MNAESFYGSRMYKAQVEVVVEMGGCTLLPDDIVTVTVSLYNYARYLRECLDSIYAQTHPSLELIIVDDSSGADDSLVVAENWLKSNGNRFVHALLLKHRRNQGLAVSRNTAFSHACSDAVFVIDADNAIYPRAISRLYETFRETGAGAVYSQLEFFGNERRLGHADVWSAERLKTGNYIDAMALVSKLAWTKVGGYSDNSGMEDYDFWCKFIEMEIKAIYIPEILCRYRVHSTSMLRTETHPLTKEIFIRMSFRHPWLELP